MSIDEWIEDAENYSSRKRFLRIEIMRKMNRFGNMVQAFSTYEARNSMDGDPIARGINSIQLLKKDGRWWIVTVMWDNESKDNPIPEEFLPYFGDRGWLFQPVPRLESNHTEPLPRNRVRAASYNARTPVAAATSGWTRCARLTAGRTGFRDHKPG